MEDDAYAAIAGLYDLAYGDYSDDITFYENLSRAFDGPALELGVGTGRVAIPLAQAGRDVVGIDASPEMLARAEANRKAADLPPERLELVRADMTAFTLRRQFDFIFVAADTFQHLLTTGEQQACLRCVADHLRPGGLFVMSVRSPASVEWAEGGLPAPLLLDWTRRDPATGDLIMKLVAAEPDAARMTRRLTYIYDRIRAGNVIRTLFETELRYSTQAEIELLLQDARLRVTHVYGDYDLSPVGHGADNLIFVARSEKQA